MNADLEIYIQPDGTVQSVYSDALTELFSDETAAVTRRASHVEPHASGGWYADLRPVGGPVLGDDLPFGTRQAALDAEVAWLRTQMEHGPVEFNGGGR